MESPGGKQRLKNTQIVRKLANNLINRVRLKGRRRSDFGGPRYERSPLDFIYCYLFASLFLSITIHLNDLLRRRIARINYLINLFHWNIWFARQSYVFNAFFARIASNLIIDTHQQNNFLFSCGCYFVCQRRSTSRLFRADRKFPKTFSSTFRSGSFFVVRKYNKLKDFVIAKLEAASPQQPSTIAKMCDSFAASHKVMQYIASYHAKRYHYCLPADRGVSVLAFLRFITSSLP